MTMGNKTVKVYVLKGLNGTSLVIENFRVSNETIYGLLTPIYTFEVLTDDILQAIGQKHNQSEDCVSREAVFETIDNCNSDGLKGIFCSYDDGERFKEYIKKLPLATPTHKVGKWIPIWDKDHLVVLAYQCSECETMRNTTTNYCADCGAEMEGVEDV